MCETVNYNIIIFARVRLARAGADPQEPLHLHLPPLPGRPGLPVLQEQHGVPPLVTNHMFYTG